MCCIKNSTRLITKFLSSAPLVLAVTSAATAQQTILNSSYDIARELFQAYNPEFQAYWKEQTGEDITIQQSHSGSSKQARAILQGLEADVVTFNQVTDVNVLHDKGNLIPADWNTRLPNNSSPYYSTTAFLVRKGNPKNIQGWADLAKEDVSVVFPNPKTSGNGRYTYLAAWMATSDRPAGNAAVPYTHLTLPTILRVGVLVCVGPIRVMNDEMMASTPTRGSPPTAWSPMMSAHHRLAFDQVSLAFISKHRL